jgi:TonB-dependent receptor
MQRITGVSLERDQGEGRFISVRGVDPDLNNTQLNGVNVPASQEDSRKVNLDVFPTDILASIEVIKAVTADMDGDAIGGTVNIKTQTAFDSNRRILRGSAETGHADLVDKWGYKYSAVWADKFLDGKLGILASWSASKRVFGSNGLETDDNPWVTDANGFIEPGADIQHREYNVTRWRSGASLSLDFRPDAFNSYYLRGVYSRFSDYENRFRTRFRGAPARTTPTSNTTGAVTGSRIQIDLKDRYEDNKVWAFSAGGEHKRDDWQVDYVAAWSLAKLIDPFRYQPVFRTAATTYSYDISNNEKPVFTGTGVAITPSGYTFNGWALDRGFNDEDEWTFAANFKRDMRFGAYDGHLKFGAKYRMKSRTVDISSDAMVLATGTLTLDQFARFSPRGAVSTVPSINPKAFREFYEANKSLFTTNANDTAVNAALEDYGSDENVLAGYAMADVTMGKFTLIGGVRAEATDYQTTGWSVTNASAATLTPTGASRDYTSILPSLVGRYDFSKRMIGRASFTTTLARPKPLDASTSREIDSTSGDVSQGNPNLKPYRAYNWDASLEFYPESLGVMSFGVFYKDISDFIYSEVLAGGGLNGGSLSTPLNGDAAKVSGFEAEWQQQLTMLPSPFDGLGFYANATLTDSESVLGGGRSGEKVPFLNQSKRIYNVALSYEKYGFFTRLSLNHRSRYLSLLGSSTAGDQYVQDHTQLDLSANYKISPRFTVYAEFLNLTNEPYSAVYNVTNGARKVEFYSWSANAGVKFNF